MKKLRNNNPLLALVILSILATSALATPPRVIKTTPEHGDQFVDPGLDKIVIEFDQDMRRGGFSVCGGGNNYPKTVGLPKWINKRTLVMQVNLESSHVYELSINCQNYQKFKNLQGESAVIYPIKFKTTTALRKKSPPSIKSPRLLYQEGLYAEQTEGNLNKAIELYEQVIDNASKIQRLIAQATYQLGICHLKKEDKIKAAEYFQDVVSNYPTQKTIAKKAAEQLKKIKPESKTSVYAQIDSQTIRFISGQFGRCATLAGQQHLKVISFIYFVDSNGFRYQGGMNAYYNWTGRTIAQSEKVNFYGTSYWNQTYYGVDGQELNMEIVPDKTRSNHWQVYWIPDKPLEPQQSLYYGWSMNERHQFPQLPDGIYSLTMENNFGSPVIETFFLVLPKDMEVLKSNPPSGSAKLLNFSVYWWTKTLHKKGENHLERVELKKIDEKLTKGIKKRITLKDKLQAEELATQGWKLWRQKKLVESEEVFKKAIAKNPEAEGAHQGLGWAQLNQGRKLDAMNSFERCVEINPKNSAALNGLGWIAHGQGHIDEAIQWWEKSVAAQPGATASLSGLTQVYMEKQGYEKAIEYYEMWLKVEPGNEKAREGLNKAKDILVAFEATLSWLKLVDDEKYSKSWEQASAFFKTSMGKKEWSKALSVARKPLGQLMSREVLSKTYTRQVPGAPDGEYVIIIFNAVYKNKEVAMETVTPMREKDGKWRVSGYFIE